VNLGEFAPRVLAWNTRFIWSDRRIYPVESAQIDIPAQHPEQQAQHQEQQASRLRGPAAAFILTPHV